MGGDDFLYQIHAHFSKSLFQVLDDGPRALTAFFFPFSDPIFSAGTAGPQTLEPVFAYPAAGALPISGKVFKGGPFGDFPLLVSPVRVVDITAGTGALTLELFLVFAHSRNSPLPFLLVAEL
jgi:hypothetical protein